MHTKSIDNADPIQHRFCKFLNRKYKQSQAKHFIFDLVAIITTPLEIKVLFKSGY